MGSGAAEAAVVDQERSSQAQKRLDRQERYLPTRRDRRAPLELAKFLPRPAGGQIQEIGKLSHIARLLATRGQNVDRRVAGAVVRKVREWLMAVAVTSWYDWWECTYACGVEEERLFKAISL